MLDWLKGSFIDFKEGNNSVIYGKDNINIQDVTGSTINIGGTIDPSEIIGALREEERIFIHLFIICESSGIQNVLNWKPFQEDTFFEILKSASSKHKVKFRSYFFNEIDTDISEVELAYLKYLKNKSILIIDKCNVVNEQSKQFLKAYNDFQIGGCIFLNQAYSCHIVTGNLSHLHMYNDKKQPLYELLDASVGKLKKKATEDTDLIDAIGVLSERMGAKPFRSIDRQNGGLKGNLDKMAL